MRNIYNTIGKAHDPIGLITEGINVKDTITLTVILMFIISYGIFSFNYALKWLYDNEMSGTDCQRETLRYLLIISLMINVSSILLSRDSTIIIHLVTLILNSIFYNWLAEEPFNPNSGVRDIFIGIMWTNVVLYSIVVMALLGFDMFSIITIYKKRRY